MPTTNVVSEWSFSALNRLKSWLRSTAGQARLNSDGLPMTSVANESESFFY